MDKTPLSWAYKTLRYARVANMDVLVSLGILTAYIASIVDVIYIVVTNTLRNENDESNFADHPHSDLTSIGHSSFEVPVFLITFILLGKYLESIAKGKTFDAITHLINLQPAKAVLLTADSNSEHDKYMNELEVDIELVQGKNKIRIACTINEI